MDPMEPALKRPPFAGLFSSAPARSRTWIYRLGGGRLIHWTTRAKPRSGSVGAPARLAAPAVAGSGRFGGEAAQSVAHEPVGDPFVHPLGAEAPVEAERELVPG